ncbi:MAG: hypothetical protein HY292_21270 [Planctomycetes bacterium]|nr:hypothetical protein [Planctomycetota bacterium]
MPSIFRSFERFDVGYLLINGQASVAYGASTFSEDVDIWILPTNANTRRLLRALARCRATVHKLTPPLTKPNLLFGHGFHFLIPTTPMPTYLDVMAKPPRVGSFADARARAQEMQTPWGRVPVVSIEDLIALKQTRRLSDYEVISNLVRIRVANEPNASRRLLRWAARNTYRAEDRVAYRSRLGERASETSCRVAIQREIARLQSRDAAYWERRLAHLRRLRKQNALLVEGTPASRLVSQN